MAYMVEYTSGVICVAMEGADLDRLKLPLMVRSSENEEAMYTAFAVTVDLKDGITTGAPLWVGWLQYVCAYHMGD